MQVIYIASTIPSCGKTALCYGLAARLQQDGFRVGYFQPLVIVNNYGGRSEISEDAVFMRQALDLKAPLERLAPVMVDARVCQKILGGQTEDLASRIVPASVDVAKDKDILIVEGASTLTEGQILGLPPPKLAALLKARVLILIKYNNERGLDDLLAAQELFGSSFLGAIINEVPQLRREYVEHTVVPFLNRRGMLVYATLPQERLLMAFTINEIAEFLGAEILNSPEQGEKLVENFLVGAMTVDAALGYFRRQPYKAVITGGDRPDIQLAALETSTRCIILTGNIRPNPIILNRAEESSVPLLLARQDTLSVIEIMERFFGQVPFHLPPKVRRFQELLAERFDFQQLYADLDLKPK